MSLLHYFKRPKVSAIESGEVVWGLWIICGCSPRTGRAWSWELSQRGSTSAHYCCTDEMNSALHLRASSVASIWAKYWSGRDMDCWGAGNWSATCHLFQRGHNSIPQKFLWTDSNQPKSLLCATFTGNDFCLKKLPNYLHCFTSSLLSCFLP